MAAQADCKKCKPDSPQRWLGSLRSPNQRFAQSPCGWEVARAVDPFCCNRQLQQKLQLALLAGSLRQSFVYPASPVQIAMGTAPRRLPVIGSYIRRWRVMRCFAVKRACPVPCFLRMTWTKAGPETKKPGCRRAHQAFSLAYRNFSTRTVSAGVEPAAGSNGATSLDSAVPSENGALPAPPRTV